jgi:hypothetical protein
MQGVQITVIANPTNPFKAVKRLRQLNAGLHKFHLASVNDKYFPNTHPIKKLVAQSLTLCSCTFTKKSSMPGANPTTSEFTTVTPAL